MMEKKLERKKNWQIKGLISHMWLILYCTVQLVIPIVCTKFQNPRHSSSWKIFEEKKVYTQTEKAKTLYPLYTSYTRGGGGGTAWFLWVEALPPSQQFFSHVGTFSWVRPVLSNEDEVSFSRTQHRAPGETWTCDLAIKSGTLLIELTVLPSLVCVWPGQKSRRQVFSWHSSSSSSVLLLCFNSLSTSVVCW